MASLFTNVLSDADIAYIHQLPEVISAKEKLQTSSSGVVTFTIPLTSSIRDVLSERFGMDVSTITNIPLRWIQGDTAPHIDVGRSTFENTYLVYLNDCPGEFLIEDASYPISENTGFAFHEGLSHRTQNTGAVSRLLLGPMNEFAQPVGSPLSYYPTEADALAYTNALGYSGSYIVGDGGPFGGFTQWRIASNSDGTSSQSIVYNNGDVLNNDGVYNLYPAIPCFLEGTTILAIVDGVEKYVPVETLRNGDLVKTSLDGYKAVVAIGKGEIQNPGDDTRTENRLYKCPVEKYSALTSDLYITGCHSILEFPITEEQKEATIKHLGKLFVTDNKYRLMACVDERAEPWKSEGTYTIWHFALEHEDPKMNYGVYANGGLLVETCSINFLKNRSNMTLC
jgi:hypothetical protein